MRFLEYSSFQGKKEGKKVLFICCGKYIIFLILFKKSSNKKEAKEIDIFLAYNDLANF